MEVRYIEIKTSLAGQIIRAYTLSSKKRNGNGAARHRPPPPPTRPPGGRGRGGPARAVRGGGGRRGGFGARGGRSSVMAWPGCSCSFSACGWPTGFTGRPTRRSGCVNPYKDMTLAARRARKAAGEQRLVRGWFIRDLVK